MSDVPETELPFEPGELPPPPRRPAAAAPALPDYELGEEIGRGGMGVVYRGRDRRLDRAVAVKFVLAGGYADREERERFLTEARVTARLQHPNIVQVFEVGDAGGVPYMVLELVEGGTLARAVAGAPLPPAEAATLTETLARAVAYAHSRGVIHRDLKPGNVLIGPIGPIGPIKIADFGLAKVADADQARTRTGVLVGTPSYMAPEQVEERAAVGPAVDVYALGAILYELLTGRPPFRAASAFETLEQVCQQPPVAPTMLQPRLPRDLNTICLKCLEKDPARRYASAEALADDLRRYLDGRPIVARPIGTVGRTWRWAKRNPRVAGLLAALCVVFVAGSGGVFSQWRRAEDNYVDSQRNLGEAQREGAIAQQRAAELQQAIDNTVFLVGVIDNDQLFHLRILPPRKELLEPSLREYRAFIAEHGEDPEREAEVVSAHYRVAILTRLIGTRQEALEIGRKALELQRRFVERHPDVAQYRRDLAASYHNVGFLIHRDGTPAESDAALPFLRHARLLREEFVDVQRENLDYLSELAGVLNDIGLALGTLERHREADEAFAQATQHQERALDSAPHVRRYRLLLANHLFNRARCQLKLNRFDEALKMAARLPELQPDDAEAQVRFARVAALTLAARGTVSPGDELLDRALRALGRAADLDAKSAAHWITTPDFQPLATIPGFVALRERLRNGHELRLSSAPRQ